MPEKMKPKPSFSGLTYGFIVYWVTIAGTVVTIIGSVIAFISQANFAKTSYWISTVWQGQSTREIWGTLVDSPLAGHWYIHHLATGDGLSAFGISTGIFAVTLAMVGTAIVMFKKKEFVFGILAVIAALITTVSLLALIPLPV